MKFFKTKFMALERENQRLLDDLQKATMEKQQLLGEFLQWVQ